MHKQLYFILILALIFHNCANQTQPTGGPEDEEPPVLQSTSPPNGTVNYTGTSIRLVFNEDLQLQNAKAQILITPRTTVDYDIRVRRNEVIMEFDSLLDSNTTYTINFRESIQDITEGNPAENLQLAFSTGPQLDSLYLKGNVYHMLSGNIPEKATVVLYRTTDTTDIFTDQPYYFTQTTDSGKFELNNLKAGSYRMYAFQDYNNNLKAESAKEPYGYLPDTLNLTSSDSSITIPLVNLDIGQFRMLSNRTSGPIYIARYNKAVVNYTYKSSDSLLAQFDPADPATIQFYPPTDLILPDSVFTVLTVSDSVNHILTDTLYVQFDYESTRGADYSLRTDIPPVIVRKPTLYAEFIFNKPTDLLLRDSVFIQLDSSLIIPFDSIRYQWNYNHNRLNLEYTFADSLFRGQQDNTSSSDGQRRVASSARPIIYVGNSAFRSILSDSLQSRSYSLSFSRAQSLSRLILRTQTDRQHYILQLLSDDRVYRSVRNPDSDVVYFNDLEPGEYQLRVIIDENNNGVWDPGILKALIPPETIKYYIPKTGQRTMELRANFDWDETFSF